MASLLGSSGLVGKTDQNAALGKTRSAAFSFTLILSLAPAICSKHGGAAPFRLVASAGAGSMGGPAVPWERGFANSDLILKSLCSIVPEEVGFWW